VWEDDELKVAVDIYLDEGTIVLPEDELAEKIAIDCVDTIADEELVVEATELLRELDELKDAIDIYVDEGTAVLPDDELASMTLKGKRRTIIYRVRLNALSLMQ